MGVKIVIVDAEPVVRRVVAAILQKEGYEVIDTGDPVRAAEIVTTVSPSLIITNVSLPGISGHEAMKLFKRHAPDIPVLMLSGLPDVELIQEWRGRDGFAVFPKPFKVDELTKAVREMLAQNPVPDKKTNS